MDTLVSIKAIRGLSKDDKLKDDFIIATYSLKVLKVIYDIPLYVRTRFSGNLESIFYKGLK
jgi:hypothetical protein